MGAPFRNIWIFVDMVGPAVRRRQRDFQMQSGGRLEEKLHRAPEMYYMEAASVWQEETEGASVYFLK